MKQIFIFFFCCLLIVMVPKLVIAQERDERVKPVVFGIMSLARGQNAQLNVTLPPNPNAPPSPIEPCLAKLSFIKKNGEPFYDRSGLEVSKVVRLTPGKSASLKLKGVDAFFGTDSKRVPFVAVVGTAPSDDTYPPCTQWFLSPTATVEVYDRDTGGDATVLMAIPDCTIIEPEPQCFTDSDCSEGSFCVFGLCVPENAPIPELCESNRDCPPGMICVSGVCLPY